MADMHDQLSSEELRASFLALPDVGRTLAYDTPRKVTVTFGK